MTLFTRATALAPNSFDEATHTIRAVWSTGADVVRQDGQGRYIERLSLAPEHVNLDGLQGASVLDSHQRGALGHVLGSVKEASADGREGRATIQLSRNPERAGVIADIAAGIIRHLSVGYSVESWRDSTENGQRVRTAVAWSPKEISFVSVPADRGANTRSEEIAMNTSPPPANTETGRAVKIRNIGKALKLSSEFVDGLIDRGISVKQARRAALAEMQDRGVRINPAVGGIDNGDPAVIISRQSAALAHRLGAPGALPDEAVQFRGLGLHDMLRTVLAARGERVIGMSVDNLITRAIATGDLTALLESTGNRTLLPSFQLARSPLFDVAREATIPDFRTASRIRLGELALLTQVPEGGEVETGGVAEEFQSYKLATYARIFSITMQALQNDDLGAFGQLSNAMGTAAAETMNQLVVTLLTQASGLGPNLQDGVRLFNAAHGNVGTAGAIAVATLAAAVQAMRNQKGISGQPINVVPKFLVVSTANELTARQAVAAFFPAAQNVVQPFSFDVAVEPRLTGTRWYVFASPDISPVVEYSYLSGAPGPQMVSRQGFEVLGMQFRVHLNFGVGVIDWRGSFTNAGA